MTLNLLCVAQHFGFGPVSNLFSILKVLKIRSSKNLKIFLIKNESTTIFFQKNPNLVDELITAPNYNNFNLILSCYDPFPIVEGWLRNKHTIYCCNLFWFWNVPHKLDLFKKYKAELSQLKSNKELDKAILKFKQIFKQNPHLAIFLAYFLADVSFIRRFPKADESLARFKGEINYNLCGALMYNYNKRKDKKVKNQIVFQMSGSRNPITTMEENLLYATFVLDILKKLKTKFKKLKIIVVLNPIIFTKIKNYPPNIKVIPSVSQNENLKFLEESVAFFISPGLGIIYEAAFIGCPIFFLPEQNAGQYPNYNMLRNEGYNADNILIGTLFPNRKIKNGEEDIHEIFKYINKIHSDNNLMKKVKGRIENFLKKISIESNRQKYINTQQKTINKILGSSPFEGAETVAEYILSLKQIKK